MPATARQISARHRELATPALYEAWGHQPVVHRITDALALPPEASPTPPTPTTTPPTSILNQIQLDTVTAPHVRDPAAYAATLVDATIDRLAPSSPAGDAPPGPRPGCRRPARAWDSHSRHADTIVEAASFAAVARGHRPLLPGRPRRPPPAGRFSSRPSSPNSRSATRPAFTANALTAIGE